MKWIETDDKKQSVVCISYVCVYFFLIYFYFSLVWIEEA